MVLKEATLAEILIAAQEPEELGIPEAIVEDLLFRLLYDEGRVSLSRAGEVIRVHGRVLDRLLEFMQREHLIEVASAGQVGRMSYSFQLTDAGRSRAREAYERSQYLGPAPVSIERYRLAVQLQSANRQKVKPDAVIGALKHLVLPEHFHRSIGPAINSGKSLFLYGPPGNGKTTVALAIGGLISGETPIWLPYAVTVGGQIVTIYDPLIHEPFPVPDDKEAEFARVDKRWGLFRRPLVVTGGELTMESLDLRYDPIAKYYEAPLQMKANGGMLLIDDFGRQMVSPSELLNRWIVPLESEIDYLRLRTGQTMEIPFKQLLVFSTNLDPLDLVDDAFLRRIQMKVGIFAPDERMFFQLFQTMCQMLDLPFDRTTFVHLVQEWYRKTGRPMQAVHPRDLLNIVVAMCEYEDKPNQLTPELIDEACRNYFV
ncbi:MAG: ATP-binding protein [Anaerolineae bacterium]|nr:ATP-binding protein [Anaerolineae bacterium]